MKNKKGMTVACIKELIEGHADEDELRLVNVNRDGSEDDFGDIFNSIFGGNQAQTIKVMDTKKANDFCRQFIKDYIAPKKKNNVRSQLSSIFSDIGKMVIDCGDHQELIDANLKLQIVQAMSHLESCLESMDLANGTAQQWLDRGKEEKKEPA